jgi:hypothetical protein
LIEKKGITTKDGEMETFICHPERNRRSPAVFFLMDAYGIREELKGAAGPGPRLGWQAINGRPIRQKAHPLCRFFAGRHWEETQRLRIPEGGRVAPARLNGAITLKSILDRAPG